MPDPVACNALVTVLVISGDARAELLKELETTKRHLLPAVVPLTTESLFQRCFQEAGFQAQGRQVAVFTLPGTMVKARIQRRAFLSQGASLSFLGWRRAVPGRLSFGAVRLRAL